MWFIAYRHSLRLGESGVKFVQSETDAAAEGLNLESSGYVVTKVAPTSKTRMNAFLAGTLSNPEQPVLG